MNTSTSQNSQLPPEVLDLIERWVIQAIPEAEEQDRHLTVEYDGMTVTISEHLAPSGLDHDTDWIRRPAAQLRYQVDAPTDRAWALFAPDINDDWYPYEHFNQPGSKFTGTLEDALADIEEDREEMFFGMS